MARPISQKRLFERGLAKLLNLRESTPQLAASLDIAIRDAREKFIAGIKSEVVELVADALEVGANAPSFINGLADLASARLNQRASQVNTEHEEVEDTHVEDA